MNDHTRGSSVPSMSGIPLPPPKRESREKAVENVTDAFALWEKEYRENPGGYMDEAARKASTPGDLGEARAIYFCELLDRVRSAKGE
jgi:hypothetical protein